jgi:hypothetical protein
MDLRVNLKVCEGCGCLWYRTQVEIRVYCTACNERFKEFPTPQSRKRRGRPKKMLLPTVFAVRAEAQSTWNSELEERFSEYAHTKVGHSFSPQTGSSIRAQAASALPSAASEVLRTRSLSGGIQ